MNERRILWLLELAKHADSEATRESARKALRAALVRASDAGMPQPAPVPEKPQVTWRQPAFQLGVFMVAACIAVSTGTGFIWTLIVSAICAKLWCPKI